MALFEYNICNQADSELFHRQCRALEAHVPGLQADEVLADVDGSLIQIYRSVKGTIKVKSDTQVDAVYVVSEFDLLPYFS